jgi:ATP-dependent RNA helicase DeaD
MDSSLYDSTLSADLLAAIDRKGYVALTPIQQAVLDPKLANRDLRITSVTGSGKTLAIGFVLQGALEVSPSSPKEFSGPRVIIIVPTRELAQQVKLELSWLFEERKLRIESVTGGTSIRDERRALARAPTIVVGTPGRLLDHLRRGAIVTDRVAAVVLDEADRMLDMGFQEDLSAILESLPKDRQTHMASATFCNEVGRLADRHQRNAVHVQGTPLGEVNSDIEHIVHVVNPGDKFNAIVNLLLVNPEEQSILFARTRVDVTSMTRELAKAGFSVISLSGEMTQPTRDRALATFRSGSFKVLVATDVAARGLDIQGVKQIIHLEPPNDPDSYVHRSGRTGRAGLKGTSRLLVVPVGVGYVKLLMRRAGVNFRVMPIPTAETLLAAQNDRLFSELSNSVDADSMPTKQHTALAERLCAEGNNVELVTRLLARINRVEIAPRNVTSPRVETANLGSSRSFAESNKRKAKGAQFREAPRSAPSSRTGTKAGAERRIAGNKSAIPNENYGAFHVTWGEDQGADARRLLAIVCRRGRIRSNDVGEIRIGPTSSVIEVRRQVAAAFAKAAQAPDRRDPRVHIAPLRGDRALRAIVAQ